MVKGDSQSLIIFMRKIRKERDVLLLAGVLSLLLPMLCCASSARKKQDCTYDVLVWNVNKKSSGPIKHVQRSREDLSQQEIDPATGCTICSEDQVHIGLSPLPSFSICSKVAAQVQDVFEELLRRGAPITSVVGYLVIKSRGPVDHEGNRTEFSNHSFGTAIDVNPDLNGLYDNCVKFGPECRLLRGGEWRIGVPGTLQRDSDVVLAFKSAGFRWGGEIEGKQKDFMHFSLTGY